MWDGYRYFEHKSFPAIDFKFDKRVLELDLSLWKPTVFIRRYNYSVLNCFMVLRIDQLVFILGFNNSKMCNVDGIRIIGSIGRS